MQHDPAMDMPDFVTEGYEEVEQSGAPPLVLHSAALPDPPDGPSATDAYW